MCVGHWFVKTIFLARTWSFLQCLLLLHHIGYHCCVVNLEGNPRTPWPHPQLTTCLPYYLKLEDVDVGGLALTPRPIVLEGWVVHVPAVPFFWDICCCYLFTQGTMCGFSSSTNEHHKSRVSLTSCTSFRGVNSPARDQYNAFSQNCRLHDCSLVRDDAILTSNHITPPCM